MTAPAAPPRIAISAGHHNETGGDHREIAIVGAITAATIAYLQAARVAVRSITPNNGLGKFEGTVSEAADTVNQWTRDGWRPDVFIEIHAEANGSGDAGRGCFVIYPDARSGHDTDDETRDVLAPIINKKLSAATGIPTRGTGTMSERHTQVGREGHRLGVFAATAAHRQHMRRLIVEVGSYTSRADLQKMHAPGYSKAAGRAIAAALCAYFDWPEPTSDEPIYTYRVIVERGANVRKQPNSRPTTAILRALPRGATFQGTPITGDDGLTWIKTTTTGYVRADLVQQRAA